MRIGVPITSQWASCGFRAERISGVEGVLQFLFWSGSFSFCLCLFSCKNYIFPQDDVVCKAWFLFNCTSFHSTNFHWGPTACWTLLPLQTHSSSHHFRIAPQCPRLFPSSSWLVYVCCLIHIPVISFIHGHWSYPYLKPFLTSLFFYPTFNSSIIPVGSKSRIIQNLTASSNPQYHSWLQAWVTAVRPDCIVAPRLSVPMTLVSLS